MSEFPCPIKLDTLGTASREVKLKASPEQRAALAERFGLLALDALTATAGVRREGDTVFAEGRIAASVVQACVATTEPVPATIDEPFSLRFVPEPDLSGVAEVELADADLDTLGYSGGAIDLGEAVAETLSLALDPFPRSPDADAKLTELGILKPEDVGPFAALKGLKDRLRS